MIFNQLELDFNLDDEPEVTPVSNEELPQSNKAYTSGNLHSCYVCGMSFYDRNGGLIPIRRLDNNKKQYFMTLHNYCAIINNIVGGDLITK